MNREESRPTLSEHINRLQQRQLELVQQTNSELEMLRKQVEDTESAEQRLAAEKEPLLAEIQELRSSVRYLEEERSEQARQYQELRAQMDSYAAHIRNIAESLSSNLPSLPMEMEPTKNALVKKAPAPLPLVRPEPLPSLPAKRKPAGGIVRKLVPKRGAMVRFALLALVATGGYAGWNSLTGATPADTGQVAGVSTATTTATSSSSESTLPDYAQSFAELPFDETQWQKTTDPEFGIVIDYPENTSNRVYTIGSNNMWFLRKHGYLMKITRTETEKTLDAWFETAKMDYAEDYEFERGTFKSSPAWVATAKIPSDSSGTQYFVKKGPTVMSVWVKDEDPETDDGQRIARMLSSLQLTK